MSLLVADAVAALWARLEPALFCSPKAPLDKKAATFSEMPATETCEKFEHWKKQRLVRTTPASGL
jgi:hypothetical protein